MNNDRQGLDGATPASSAGVARALEAPSESAIDDYGAVGYEAADPSLQAPAWRETVSDMTREAAR